MRESKREREREKNRERERKREREREREMHDWPSLTFYNIKHADRFHGRELFDFIARRERLSSR